MRQAIDETGHKYGRLTVIGKVDDPRSGQYWSCICDCGRIITARGSSLRARHYNSCGCYRNEKMSLPEGQAENNALISYFRSSAKQNGHVWDLTDLFALMIAKQNCFYCNAPPSNVMPTATGRKVMYSGIDRVDSNKDYTTDNVVPACAVCNKAKNAMDIEEFKKWVTKVYNHFVTGEL